MAVPQSKIYKRNYYESKMEQEAKRQRLQKYENSDQLVQSKNKKKDGDKAPGLEQSKTAPPPDKKQLTAKQIEKQQTQKPNADGVKKEDKREIETLKQIRLDAVDPKTISRDERKESMPPETKDLQKAVMELLKSKENNNDPDFKKLQKDALAKLNFVRDKILPKTDDDESGYKNIIASRKDEFDKYKDKENKQQVHV